MLLMRVLQFIAEDVQRTLIKLKRYLNYIRQASRRDFARVIVFF